jgi:hypothetical protein
MHVLDIHISMHVRTHIVGIRFSLPNNMTFYWYTRTCGHIRTCFLHMRMFPHVRDLYKHIALILDAFLQCQWLLIFIFTCACMSFTYVCTCRHIYIIHDTYYCMYEYKHVKSLLFSGEVQCVCVYVRRHICIRTYDLRLVDFMHEYVKVHVCICMQRNCLCNFSKSKHRHKYKLACIYKRVLKSSTIHLSTTS